MMELIQGRAELGRRWTTRLGAASAIIIVGSVYGSVVQWWFTGR